jgi:DNA polymerase-1
MVFDGLNTFIRSFGATPAYNEDGDHIGGITGFLYSVGKTVRDLRPSRCVIVFDGKGGSAKRKRIYSDYKGNRANKTKLRRHDHHETTLEQEQESMRHQFIRLISYLDNLPITFISMDGIEADDTIAYITDMYQDISKKITVVSTDRDFYQLLSPTLQVWSPIKKKMYDIETVQEEFGVHPNNMVLYRSFTGDSSDNIPGVPKLGPKKLLKNFPELQEEQTVVLKEILEKSKQTKGTMYESVSMFSHQLKINEKLMDLHNPNLSEMMKLEIQNVIECPKSTMDKTKFLNMYNMDFLGNSIPNVESWLINVFTHLLSSKK